MSGPSRSSKATIAEGRPHGSDDHEETPGPDSPPSLVSDHGSDAGSGSDAGDEKWPKNVWARLGGECAVHFWEDAKDDGLWVDEDEKCEDWDPQFNEWEVECGDFVPED
ncbi:Uu.00g099850.m01.CDS01 [Anthostomella pinea]|uniref:Uu.00g099850.m01.CDS01 n=1 Tax=Anthostomella pinea TaxID=933095 RepID=A0AAI8YF64_9PEZI|nr:Uu.00g099850.m01.CDS01 [Anthostomella pinea]